MTEDTRNAAIRSINKTTTILIILWTLALALCCAYQLHGQRAQSLELVRAMARTSYEKDVIYRLWNSMHGGVYVPVSEIAAPNPYLDAPNREITGSDGRVYTLINPAYMTRQAHELMAKRQGITGHITSLDPIRPENAPDAWERAALTVLRDDKLEEYSAVTACQGGDCMRLIKPLYVGETCMPCHARQGYKPGQLRGGISVTVPMAPYSGLFLGSYAQTGGIYLVLWLIGALGVKKGSSILIREIAERMDQLRDREKRLAVSERNLRLIIENAPEGMLIHSEGAFTFANEKALGILGVSSPAELTAQDFKAITPESCSNLSDKNGCRDAVFERSLRRGDGASIHVEISMVALADAVSSKRLIYVKDVTRRKADEIALKESKARAEDANKAKSEFLANMSHEIRTPLNGVMGMLQMLQMSGLDADKRGWVDTALECSEKLLLILNDILDLARIESGRLEPVVNVFPPKAMIREIAALFAPQIETKHIDLSVEVDEAVPDIVRADEGRMRQILFNLLSNAVKFTDQGAITLSLTCAPAAKEPGRIKLVCGVEDTGQGFAGEKADYIFESFTQADGKYTRRHGGVGLGLAIVKRLSRLLGADLCVESVPGEGTFFYMGFPAVIEELPALKAANKPSLDVPAGDLPEDAAVTGSPLILVVDDDPSSQASLSLYLERLGCRHASAASGEEALEYLSENPADLVLADVQMPGMSGLEMTRRIRASDKAMAATPIVAVTAHAMKGDKEMFLAAGMDAYLAKPVDFSELTALLHDFFS